MSFVGSYRFASPDAIDAALFELREVLASPAAPTPYVIDGGEVRFSFSQTCPSDWFDELETIVQTFAEHAISGSVEVRCEGETYAIEAG